MLGFVHTAAAIVAVIQVLATSASPLPPPPRLPPLLPLPLPPCVNRYPPRGTALTGGMSNMVLAYMDARSLPGPLTNAAFVWNVSMFKTLITPPPPPPVPSDALDLGLAAKRRRPPSTGFGFFDGVLLIPNTWFNNSAFAPDAASNYTTQSDWRQLLDLFVNTGAVLLDRAAASATNGDPHITPTSIKLVLSTPTPDPRAERWGSTASGRPLNLTIEADRIAAANWFIDTAVEQLAALDLQHISFVGFYWYNELIRPADRALVQAVAAHVHSAAAPESPAGGAGGAGAEDARAGADAGGAAPAAPSTTGLIFTWIPYFESIGWQSWAEFGFDFATMQPNWAFHAHSCCPNATALFARVANDTRCRGMGIEMEMPLAVRNPQIANASWRASFDAYAAASATYNWGGTVRTYYYGNDFVTMAREDPLYFEQLYRVVTFSKNMRGRA